MNAPTSTVTGERADFLESLRRHREFLLFTVKDLTDEQAASHPTVSELCLGGLIKHVGEMERGWVNFILEGPAGLGGDFDPSAWSEEMQKERANEFAMVGDDTVESIVSEYGRIAARTDELVISLDSLDIAHPLPAAPWFEPGAQWSARRVLLHLVAETSQHAGHADMLREAIDGSKTMG
ncbi:DinB family protein [Rhodococcus sp. ARC_M6]|uniref:DinB family protein n=1 Tax=Rhodococcus sp. ARC_M6 TaxID=2928852 RepID=UPI001FB4CA43|nr:DinB family protein [Rhodococcus sp. ARC_M6]MCJ0902833.1 DinB family protein [Rhodococcus sp. ARC_M6]